MSSTSSEPSGAVREEVSVEHRLSQGFTFRSAFALAFADISPIVALYAIFTLALFAAGPAFIWAFPVVLAGQLLVAAVFVNMVDRGFLKVMVLASITAEVVGRARFRAHPGTSRGVC